MRGREDTFGPYSDLVNMRKGAIGNCGGNRKRSFKYWLRDEEGTGMQRKIAGGGRGYTKKGFSA